MNWRNLVLAFFVSGSMSTFAQSNLLNAKKPQEIGLKSAAQQTKDNDKPLDYGYVDDRDILMSKKVWEIIDLDERINFSLYYPIDTISIGSDRRSLYDVLVKGIKSGKITQVYGDSYFREKKTLKDINASLTKIDTTDAGREEMNSDINAYKSRTVEVPVYEGTGKKRKKVGVETKVIPASKFISSEYINKTDLASIDVSDYKIVGLWYFDKRQSDLRYRILGICPVIPDVYTMGKSEEEKDYIDLFWIFYPDARGVLHEAKAFNEKNSSMPISFDHLLNSRRFNSVIYKEENIYNDRDISKYMKDNSLMQLIEAQRVRDKIRDFEQDMWTY
ncbi:gliding motility protein GldN [Flavobacterium columnare NBRC 100251 = ATCC 23463]|uniref:Gliding motility protein GldN n=2 Tax=Flavobacterium columnare TaxID=996 RepID=G8X810_FLACA|nr:gliding motility protein GldN [Flavobacterium columnare]AEW87124.1 gliding motility protein GldN [Flavobacterium columnare ATCC 49512]AMO21018.1 gliding motility protein GldN [Flavobacterium columnare]ANO47560.1 gliding motility protein GldN [Flavobacterium columnare]APT21807.1 gliding motility protein GldN [Flavobacterium columnare]ATB19398.1 gliding motility protein GldN [Flavobacterium columnare]